MHTFVAGGKTVTVLPASVPDAPVVYLNTFGDEGQNVFDVLASGGCPPLSLVAISGLDWNRDMAPWDCPAVFKNAGAFSGGADEYLRLLVRDVLPVAEAKLQGTPLWRGIAGYSAALTLKSLKRDCLWLGAELFGEKLRAAEYVRIEK